MNKTIVEYEEAPSGSVYFYNYKEPLMKFVNPDGTGEFGFQGALLYDTEEDKVQCHFCGNWFPQLGNHLQKEHSLTARSYKSIVGLNQKTALISEGVRAKLIAKGLERRLKNLKNFQGKPRSREVREKIKKTLKENRAELQNRRGTCPEQLIDRLYNLYIKLGRTPYAGKEVPFIEALRKVYGTYDNACRIAGVPKRLPKWTKERVIQDTHDFILRNGRVPGRTEVSSVLWRAYAKYGGSLEIFKEALARDGVYRKQNRIFRYSKEQLIEFLRTFQKTNGRKPSYSDCKRGLLPNLSRYSYNFGSWKNALLVAFPKITTQPISETITKV